MADPSVNLSADISVRYPTLTVRALLQAQSREPVVVVGRNGSGKSTLLRALAGLVELAEGRIQLGDQLLADAKAAVHVPPRDRNVGFVPQEGLLFPHMSIRDNVSFGPRSRGLSRSAAGERADHELRRLGIDDLANARSRDLSGGQRQLCSLARALATQPDLLLLDEPFSSLDATTRVEVRRAVSEALASSNVPTIMVTHDPIEAMTLGRRIIVMEEGRVAQEGSPDELRSRPRTRYVGDLVGLNVVRGRAHDSTVTAADGMTFVLADDQIAGDVVLAFHPHSISLHGDRPSGSMRNVWEARVRHAVSYGERMRIELDRPVGAAVEVSRAAAAELGLAPGVSLWASLKATEIEVFPA